MAVYKVPQDVEAEDKLVGPFTARQFIFLIIAAISGYLTIVLWNWQPGFIVFTLPLFLIFGLLGVYRRPDQPVEVYLMALLRFYFKPRKRIWSQDGVFQKVIITAPKKLINPNARRLSKAQVSSSLKSLAQIMDTRGWSAKNASLQEAAVAPNISQSDRLVMPAFTPSQTTEVHRSDDILDSSNPLAQNFDQMSRQATSNIHQQAASKVNTDDQQKTKDLSFNAYPDMKQQVVQPINQPDILRLSQNNDLNVDAIARQAQQAVEPTSDKIDIPRVDDSSGSK